MIGAHPGSCWRYVCGVVGVLWLLVPGPQARMKDPARKATAAEARGRFITGSIGSGVRSAFRRLAWSIAMFRPKTVKPVSF
jgi:hypothetical protein